MRRDIFKIPVLIVVFIAATIVVNAQNTTDTTNLPYKISPKTTNPYDKQNASSNINLKVPATFTQQVEFDSENNQYIIRNKAGNTDYSVPYYMSFDEFQGYDVQTKLKKYWRERYKTEKFEHQSSIIPKINIPGEAFETIFGSSTIDIKPSGRAALKFGVKITNNENPIQPVNLQRNTIFDFKEEIQMNVTGKIGDNLEMKVKYDTESQFEFDNTMNLRYQGKEDDIIQKIEAGNVSLPLTTSLITGSQSLFGILTELKFGKLYVSSVFSQQEGETKTITVEGGAQKSSYDISALDYDKNRHFFLAQYFRANYDTALSHLPIISSAVDISKIEVWVTNTTRSVENARNIVAFVDLGEEKNTRQIYGRTEKNISNTNVVTTKNFNVPANNANSLYEQLVNLGTQFRNINFVNKTLIALGLKTGTDFEKIEYARKLSANEYTYDAKLGYLSLNTALNSDEVLAVAFKYTVGGQVYQVGEFSTDGVDGEQALILKLLKSATFSPNQPIWNLMMKNVYSIGAYQINSDDFILEVQFDDAASGSRLYNLPDRNSLLPQELKNKKLLRVLKLDELNSQLDPVSGGDGVFDFIGGRTINAANGRIYFPVLEPFGGYLKKVIANDELARQITYQELYDSTQYRAEQVTSKNKYYLSGTYKSAGGSEIYLNAFDIPQGSVKVTAGGIVLTENVHYTVDYNMGRVKIVDESLLASGTQINISLESNSMFSVQSKTLLGTHLDYRFNKDFNLGATLMNLSERPLNEKVNVGDEPISNTIWGLNGSWRTDVPLLTKMIDFLPFIETKEMSSITVEGEFAQLVPGHNTAIGKSGNAFIDDFEGSESSIDLRNRAGWVLASTPQGRFKEASLYDNLAYGFNRAKLSWYQIDEFFFRSGSPLSDDQKSNLRVYQVNEQDIYPNKVSQNGLDTRITTLDLAYYPDERGPYNFDTEPGEYSAGINQQGKLNNPESRWGGIMRDLTTNDFEATNVEYITFWMIDPFIEESENDTKGGQLYFNLGNISEDILKDGRKTYEHGLPTQDPPNAGSYYTTAWGRVPGVQSASPAFVNDADLRRYQDIGLDGLGSYLIGEDDVDQESAFFSDYANYINTFVETGYRASILSDISADNYHHFRGTDYDNLGIGIIERYKNYNNHEGNSPVSNESDESYSTVGQQMPDVEDINSDFTLNENESYFEYRVNLNPDQMVVGSNFITDIRTTTVELENTQKREVKWYQFKIPINSPTSKYGNIQDFKSIRFLRMYMHGWEQSTVLRFARLQLVRSEWRKYNQVLLEGNESLGGTIVDADEMPFTISTVNIEENGDRSPVKYVLAPGVDRQQDPANQQLTLLNEQSMSIVVDNLADGYAKVVYKTINMDMRDYGKLQMYIHAEKRNDESPLNNGDITCIVRLGSDFSENYYEYEIPLIVSEWYNNDPYHVWNPENNMVIDFDDLLLVKQQRNQAINRNPQNYSLLREFSTIVSNGKRRITIKGNPSLSNVKTIMIGLKNPSQKWNTLSANDDGLPKSAEVWVNELRLTDFDENGGWAATGRFTARLADFGTVSVAGTTTKAGFGSIEQSGQERAKEETNQVDVAANFEMGKFFPQKANVRVPMFVGYSRSAVNPEYNPLDQDIPLSVSLKDETLSDAEKKEIVESSRDLTERKSINFTNVGIGRSSNKPKFYSPANMSVSYAYNELSHKDINTQYNRSKLHNGTFSYVYNNQPKNVMPLSKIKILKKPWLKIIGDFNFYFAPSQVSVITSVNRKYSETLLRNLNNPDQVFTPTYDKNFYWARQCDIKYNFSKGLKFDLSINSNSLIDEPDGRVDREFRGEYESFKDTVWRSVSNFGTPDSYSQNFSASYTIPINKIPLFNWVNSTARYSSTYNWDRGATTTDGFTTGNPVKNSQKINGNLQFNMDNFYGKVGFIDNLLKKYKKTAKQRNQPKTEDVTFVKDNMSLKAKQPKRVNHNLGTEEGIKVIVKSKKGDEIKSGFEIINDNRIEVTIEADANDAVVTVTGTKTVKPNPVVIVFEHVALLGLGVKQITATGDLTRGTSLPGYSSGHKFENIHVNPGLGYVFGAYDPEFGYKMALKNMIVNDTNLMQPYAWTNSQTINLKATYQPFRTLRIDINGQMTDGKKSAEYYYNNTSNGEIIPKNFTETGQFSTNIWMLGSSFSEKINRNNTSSKVFEQFRKNIVAMAWQAAKKREASQSNTVGYYAGNQLTDSMPSGYGASNPEIAIPAFIAAYANVDAANFSDGILNTKSNWAMFRPTWRVKFDGLTQIKAVEKLFKNVTISHGYNSTFNVGSYSTNVDYDYDAAKRGEYSWRYTGSSDSTFRFLSEKDITSFSATEQFMPLLGVDVTWKNNVLTKLEYKKTRSLTMSLTNTKLTEVYTWEYTLGSGYRFDKLKLIVNKKPYESDLNVRADVSVRDNITISRDLYTIPEVTNGGLALAIKLSADYQFTEKLTLRAYFDHNMTNPAISTTFKQSTTEFGFQVVFSLAQ